jgi:fatty acid amide hydrolase
MQATITRTLIRLTAVELARRIAIGETTAVEAVEAHIARIEEVNGRLNAVVVKRYDEARAEALATDERRARGEPLGPLAGVPITIKESFDLAGTPATYGIPARKEVLAARDDRYVARLRQAGAIILGKTNVPQLLLYIETDNPLYGRTNNPWDLARSPGGSSGGQAAIIAAGGSPLGLVSDIGGSIRIPATFCRLASLKPTAGRLDDPADFGIAPGQRAIVSQAGAMARSVGDLALALEILNGGRSPAVVPPMPLGDPAAVDLATLRVAYYADDGTFTVSPAVRRAVVEAAGILAGRGAQVVEWRPPNVPRAMEIFFGVLGADGGAHGRRMLRGSKKDPRMALLLLLAARSRPTLAVLGALARAGGQRHLADMLRAFGRHSADAYFTLAQAQAAYQRQFATALDTDDGGPFDLIVCPAAALPAIPHGASRDLVTAGGYAALYNVLGYPAGVVPLTRVRPDEAAPRKRSLDLAESAARKTELGSAGLPVGVQLVARPWREHLALAAMRAVEEAASSHDDYPTLAPI